MTAQELLRSERRWKGVLVFCVIVLVAALLDRAARQPRGAEVLWCYGLGGAALIASCYAIRRLADPDRLGGQAISINMPDGEFLFGADLLDSQATDTGDAHDMGTD